MPLRHSVQTAFRMNKPRRAADGLNLCKPHSDGLKISWLRLLFFLIGVFIIFNFSDNEYWLDNKKTYYRRLGITTPEKLSTINFYIEAS